MFIRLLSRFILRCCFGLLYICFIIYFVLSLIRCCVFVVVDGLFVFVFVLCLCWYARF